MVSAAPLGDVVEQHAHIKGTTRADFVDRLASHRMLFLEFAPLDLRQEPNGLDGVLIDRIDMIHVVLGLPDDTAEIAKETAEHARLVHAG